MSSNSTNIRQPIPLADLRKIPVRMGIPEAGRFFGLSRARAYELHQRGEFPTPVQRIGERYHVRGADVLRGLGLDPTAILLGAQSASASQAAPVEGA